MHKDVPGAPPWIARLPLDARGFPIPAEAAWDGDEPQIEKGSIGRSTLLTLSNACAVCGGPLGDGTVYRAFAQADAATIRLDERELASDFNGATHRSCIYYSVFACPYLSSANARLRPDTMYAERLRRGTRPAVMGFEGHGVLVAAAGSPPVFGFLRLTVDHPYKTADEVVDEYTEAVAEDAWLDEEPGLYWGAEYDESNLYGPAMDAIRSVPRRRAAPRTFRGHQTTLIVARAADEHLL